MSKHKAHLEAFGYEPLRMKPIHFASGFFIALTREVFANRLLNEVAVTTANKGLLGRYKPDAVAESLKSAGLLLDTVPQSAVEMLRIHVNGVVDNDGAMYPAFAPYRPKGNDYTFISKRVLTTEDRTDGYAGLFVASVLEATDIGKKVLAAGTTLADEPARTLENLVEPLIASEPAQAKDLRAAFEAKFGDLPKERLERIATEMARETEALSRLCDNLKAYSHYKRVRFYILGVLAWLMSYLVKTAAQDRTPSPVLFFDFSGSRESRTRLQSKTSYARLREMVGQSYFEFSRANRFTSDPIAERTFNKKTKQGKIIDDDFDFAFLETHFSDLALRMGYAQPRASNIPDKHLELQPDTLRVLMLSVLPDDPHDVVQFDEVCSRLAATWRVIVGGNGNDFSVLRELGFFGLDEEDLRTNARNLAERLKSLNLAVEPSDGLVLCSTNIGGSRMTPEKLVAQAAALRVGGAIDAGGHLFCQELPAMDVDHFLRLLADRKVDAASISIALVGYGLSDGALRAKLDRIGLQISHATTDLHIAAGWRNEPKRHPTIIALAVGRHPGVSTLAHFPQANARELALLLLEWARQPEADFVSTSRQNLLLEALLQASDLAPLVSLAGIADFLAEWRARRAENDLDAPRKALPRLGLLTDRNLLSVERSMAERLTSNFNLTKSITSMPGTRLSSIRRRAKKDSNAERRSSILAILAKVDDLRRRGDFAAYAALEYEDAQRLMKPPKEEPEPNPPIEPTATPDPPEPDIPTVRGSEGVATDSGEALIDGDDERLTEIVAGIEGALAGALDYEDEEVKGSYEIGGEELSFLFSVDRKFLTWVKEFCNEEVWGGFYETDSASFEEAVEEYRQAAPTFFRPHTRSIAHDSDLYDLRAILEPMQRELSRAGITNEDFCALWESISVKRSIVLASLDLLLHQPMLAIAAKPELQTAVAELVAAWERFYSKLAEHHASMHRIDHAWTRTLVEAVTALDIVQIETKLDAETSSWKAVLLPTHPLHLWRYTCMASLARGLKIQGSDRQAVLDQLERPEHYLGVIYLTSFPEGKGGNRPLPVARNYRGLAVFENFRNAYSGIEGVDALQRCIRQFALIYSNHTMPLRLALLNPPDASKLLVKLLEVLKPPRGNNITLLVDVYATPEHKARLRDARRFSTSDRDLIEEYIRSGRLKLQVNDELLGLEDRLKTFRQLPVHILVVFDEATTAMRKTPVGINMLPMSPFAMRRRIEFQGIKKKVELHPSAEETVFRSFYDLMGKLEGAIHGGTPQASADAERMRQHIEDVLLNDNPGAFWFFFADRALPSPGGIRAARVLEKHGRHRRAVCYDASYERLAMLLRGPLDSFNLRFELPELQDLLREGVALIGDGLIDLLKHDGQPDEAKVRGLAGTLICARDYRSRHPEALLVSVDSELARLWLRLSPRGERSDLLGLRMEGDELIVDAIEVKTCGGTNLEVPRADLDKACSQLTATLDAVRSGLKQADEDSHDVSPLGAPRQEMLKEVFVAGCQSLNASAEDRQRWAEWLKLLFGESIGGGGPQLNGVICAVELGNNSPPEELWLARAPDPVLARKIREERIHELLTRPKPAPKSGPQQPPPGKPNPPAPTSGGARPAPAKPPRPETPTPRENTAPAAAEAREPGVRFCVGESLSGATPARYYLHPSNTKLNQLNIGIVGDLGTGKTQLTKALIYQLVSGTQHNRGHRPNFLIFDYKRDYTKADFVDAVGARVVRPHRIPLNVFELGAADQHTAAARLGRVKFLNDCLHRIYGGIGPKQRNHLKTAILNAYGSAHGTPVLADVLREYEEIVGDRIDAPYSILSDIADLEIFVSSAAQAVAFREFFNGVVVIDLAELGVGEKEKNILVVMFLNFFYEYMQSLEKRPYIGTSPQLRFIDSMLLVDEADNIMRFNFDVLRQILLQGREFGVGVLLASQYLSHFKTRETDYTEPLLTWFIHKVPNVSPRELDSVGLTGVGTAVVERVKNLDVHQCLYKIFDVPGRFMRGKPFYELLQGTNE